MLDEESINTISPFIKQRDTLIKEITINEKIKESYTNSLKVRNQQENIYKIYNKLLSDIEELKEKLLTLKSNAPDLSEVLNDIGDKLNIYLKNINIKNRTGISISPKTFVPIVRDRDYIRIMSGGLRTITSIGHMLTLLEVSLEKNIHHPRLLMIDTVGKYLGKKTKSKYVDETNSKEDSKEGIGDPQKYKNIYDQIIRIANTAKVKGEHCQVILVDNDVPDSFLEEYKNYIVAHYSSIGESGLQYGLIDDYII